MTAAETRFQNDQVRAAQMSMGNNLAAKQALRPETKLSRPNNSPVRRALPSPKMNPTASLAQPMVAPQRPQSPGPSFDDRTKRLLGEIRLEKLLNAPETQDAVTRVNLRDYYNDRDSGPDKGRQILEILSTYDR